MKTDTNKKLVHINNLQRGDKFQIPSVRDTMSDMKFISTTETSSLIEGYKRDSIDDNWKPFRDRYSLVDSYLGYKILFIYKHYFFQLVVDDECELDYCNDCLNKLNSWHFAVILYGWTEEGNKNTMPYNDPPVLDDNIMPENDWLE